MQSRLKPGQAIELICRSAEELELPRGSLDKIFCFETLHDLSHPGEALQSWADLLKEDGRVYFKAPEISPEQLEQHSRRTAEEGAFPANALNGPSPTPSMPASGVPLRA